MFHQHQIPHGMCVVTQEVKEAEDLVERFLNRDKTYGELLSEVAKTKDRHS